MATEALPKREAIQSDPEAALLESDCCRRENESLTVRGNPGKLNASPNGRHPPPRWAPKKVPRKERYMSECTSGSKLDPEEAVSRRDMVLHALGAAGVGLAAAGCGPVPRAPSPNAIDVIAKGLTAASLTSTLGAAPPNPRTGDLATKASADLGGALFVIAQGAVGPGDGGGGMFYWDSVGGVDDGGIVIVPTVSRTGGNPAGTIGATGPCWRRIYDGAISVRWFGARGNETTNDQIAVQAAIDACWAAGGGTVFFPIGQYRIKGPQALQMPSGQYKPMTLLGAGNYHYSANGGTTTILSRTGDPLAADTPLLDWGGAPGAWCAGVWGAQIEGIAFYRDQGKLVRGRTDPSMGSTSRIVGLLVRDCSFKNATVYSGSLVEMSGLLQGEWRRVTVRGGSPGLDLSGGQLLIEEIVYDLKGVMGGMLRLYGSQCVINKARTEGGSTYGVLIEGGSDHTIIGYSTEGYREKAQLWLKDTQNIVVVNPILSTNDAVIGEPAYSLLIENSHDVRVTGGIIHSQALGAVGSAGLKISGSCDNIEMDTSIPDGGQVQIDPTATNVKIRGRQPIGSGSQREYYYGGGNFQNLQVHSTYLGYPNVGVLLGSNQFRSDLSFQFAVDNFVGGADGREVEIVFANANVTLRDTITANGNLRLEGGVDWTPGYLDSIRLLFIAAENKWVEIGRKHYLTARGIQALSVHSTWGGMANVAVLRGYEKYRANLSFQFNIDNFSNGVDGREVELFFANGNVVLRDATVAGGNLRLQGGVNWNPTALSSIRFVYVGAESKWIEVSRKQI